MVTNLLLGVFLSSFTFAGQGQQGNGTQPLEVTVPIFNNASCPIMGKPVSTPLFTDTEKGRIYICCKKCVSKIQADVAKAHQTAYPVVKKAGNTICPVSGDKIEKDSPTVTVQGYEVSVCCDDCIKEVQTNTQIMLTKATDPKVVDIDNKICPITEKPVAKNAFCLIGKELVRLSSPECVEAVKKDPKKALEKAKELKAKEGKKSEPKKDGHDHDGHDHGGHEKDKKGGGNE